MLTIRQQQWQTLSDYSQTAFEDRTVEAMIRAWPEEAADLELPGVRKRVRLGQKCDIYGITDGADVTRFIDLMFQWGDDFDASPETPWAREILSWQDRPPAVKIQALVLSSQKALEARLAAEAARDMEGRA